MKALSLLFLFLPFVVNAQNITTYVGTGTEGYTGDGTPATNAEIGEPVGIKFDDSGNLVICVIGVYGLVRKIDVLTGIITTIAGSDTASSLGHGGDGGPATCAAIVEPYDVCFDAAGNFYISDDWYSEVRKVTIATGIIDTFAGDRTPGNAGDGGPAKNAELADPVSVCFDTAQRYLYISTEFGHKIRKVNMLTDTITTFAGTGVDSYSGDGGPATNATFSRIFGICVDHSDNLYIADWDNARIRKVDGATGVITTICGNGTIGFSGDGGPATNAMISKPSYLCFDKCGNLYFSDANNNRVRRIDMTTGIINTIAGNGTAGFFGDGGPALSAEFNAPTGVAIDSFGNLYIGDFYNYRVRVMTFPNPYIGISASTGDTICAGTPITIQAATAAGGPTPSFQWVLNGTVMSGTTSSAYTYIPVSGDSVSCILTSSSGCVGTPTTTSNTIHIVTTASSPPHVSISWLGSSDSVCVGTTVGYTATPFIGGTSPSYQWVVDGINVGTNSNGYSYTPANGDSIRCILTSSATCAVPPTASSNTIDMVVLPYTTPTISLSGVTAAVAGSTVTVTATVTGAGSSYNINWYNNSVLFNTTTVPTVTYTKTAGTDHITATVNSTSVGCYDSATSAVHTVTVTTTGIPFGMLTMTEVQIYPNPVSDVLHIDISGAAGSSSGQAYRILSIVGATMLQGTLQQGGNSISIQALPGGMYIVEVAGSDGGKTIAKIIKQ